MNDVEYPYFGRFATAKYEDEGGYLPHWGEGSTLASQTVTAVNRLVFGWYNDGDVFDNRFALKHGDNDLSDAANWLVQNIGGTSIILFRISRVRTEAEYEQILKELADHCLDPSLLERLAREDACGSIYDCKGEFGHEEYDEEDYDEEDQPYSWNRKPRRAPKKRGSVSRWFSASKAAKGARR